MPAMSPLMNECSIAKWKKKEGEVFAPGDVLLQIVCAQYDVIPWPIYYWIKESDIAMIDVEAHSPGILGKIIVCLYEC